MHPKIRPSRVLRALPLLMIALLALALPASASASRDYEVEMMDDQLLLGKTDTQVDRAIREMVRIGVDRLRVSAFWRDIAPNPTSRRRPDFDASNFRDAGTSYRWADLDRVVAIAGMRGLRLHVSITGPGPLWAMGNPSRGPVWRPDAGEYGQFAEAVAARYRGRVDMFSIWNEPNQGAWLQPQWSCSGRSCSPTSPHIYRSLVNAAYPRIKAANPASEVLIGELAPSGTNDRSSTRPMRPLLFLREASCRSRRLAAKRGGACRGFRPLQADAIGHHPYTSMRSPTARSPHPDDAALGDTRRLVSLVDRLQSRGAILNGDSRTRRLPIHYTEFGYQTNPPDPFSGIPRGRQSLWLQEAAYQVWRQPRIKSLNQFRLTDGPLRSGSRRYVEFQSGLKFRNGRAKPSYRTFPHPIRANRRSVRRGQTVQIWGHVRRADGRATVHVERRTGRRWQRVATTRTDSHGVFRQRIRIPRESQVRYRYSGAGTRGTSGALRIRAR